MSAPIPPPPPELVELMEQPFPPQRAFGYDPEKWLKWLGDIPGATDAINSLPDAVDRDIIRQAVSDLENDNLAGAFIAVMIWGHGTVGYGPYRTLQVLSDNFRDGKKLSDAVVGRLQDSISVAREQGSVAGFSHLNNDGKLRGLGPSFFTKWLYYITATGPQGEDGAAPILDDEVINWINDNAGEQLKYKRTPSYERYLDLVTAWGAPYDLSPVDIEERIFRIIRDDGTE